MISEHLDARSHGTQVLVRAYAAGRSETESALGWRVYLASMGPDGMADLGQTILQKSTYAKALLNDIPGVVASRFKSPGFKEFVVDFTATGKTVDEINKALLGEGIFGGKDLSAEFSELGQSALYCVTEIHTQADIEFLIAALSRIMGHA